MPYLPVKERGKYQSLVWLAEEFSNQWITAFFARFLSFPGVSLLRLITWSHDSRKFMVVPSVSFRTVTEMDPSIFAPFFFSSSFFMQYFFSLFTKTEICRYTRPLSLSAGKKTRKIELLLSFSFRAIIFPSLVWPPGCFWLSWPRRPRSLVHCMGKP